MPKKKGLPKVGELVIVTVERLSPFAGWCRLEEYPDVEGMIHISEVAGKWVYDIREFIKVGKQYVTKVMKVDEDKNFVNLSLKRVSRWDRKEKMNSFRREQRAEKILERVGKQLGKTLEEAYNEIGYMLIEKFGELFIALEEIKKSPDVLKELRLPKEWVAPLIDVVNKSFREKEIKLQADLMLKNFSSDGIKKIKDVLIDLEKSGLLIKYISAPRYRVELKTKNPKVDEKRLRTALDEAVKKIRSLGGEGSYTLIRD